MKIKILVLAFLPFMLTSCDPGAFAIITNQSLHEATVDIEYNKDSLKYYADLHGGFKEFLDYQLNLHPGQIKIIHFDSIKYTTTLQMQPKDTFLLDGGLKSRPDYYKVKKLLINSETEYLGEDEIGEAFNKNGAVLYELKIR